MKTTRAGRVVKAEKATKAATVAKVAKAAKRVKAGREVTARGGFEATGVLTKFDLYRACVQDGARMVRFLQAVHRGEGAEATARILRDDFAGPAGLACAWASAGREHVGVGVDVDPEPLMHAPVTEEIASRVRLIAADVRASGVEADVIAAMNFAICEMHTRAEVISYLRSVRALLRKGGVFACDLYGGVHAWTPGALVTFAKGPIGPADERVGRIEYHWQQKEADSLTGMVENHLHFRIGAAMARKLGAQAKWGSAFVYRWRLWSIVEVREMLQEAGFAGSEVYGQMGEAVDDAGRLHVKPAGHGEELEEDYVVYVVGRGGKGTRD